MQFDRPDRGFSYKHDGPLDMRLNPQRGQPASALLARVHGLRWEAFAGFVVAAAFGIYMIWKIIRTPGEL